jgi:DNA-binding MarR family transcriptional regulator
MAKPARDIKPATATHVYPTGLAMCKSVRIPLPRAPVPMIRRLLLIAHAVSAEAFASEEWNILEFSVFMMLSREPELDQIGLAQRVGVDRTNIGIVLDRMEARGTIERRVSPHDRRSRIVRLTKLGVQELARLAPLTANIRRKLFATLTDTERETFYDLVERMIAANEQYCQPGAGRRKRRG